MKDSLGLEEYVVDLSTLDDTPSELPDRIGLEEYVVDLNILDNTPSELPEPPKKVPPPPQNPKIQFNIRKWYLPDLFESRTIVCIGRNRTGKSYFASEICKEIYDPSMNFYYIYGQDHDYPCYKIFNKAEHITYFDASNNDNSDKINKMEFGGKEKTTIVVAEQFWNRDDYRKTIHDSLCNLFFNKKLRPKNTLYIQSMESDNLYRARAQDIDYLVLNRGIYEIRLLAIYKRLGLSKLFNSFNTFHILYHRIVTSHSHGKMVVYLSTGTRDIEKFVFYDYSHEHDDDEEDEEEHEHDDDDMSCSCISSCYGYYYADLKISVYKNLMNGP